MNEIAEIDAQLYPNPATESFNIKGVNEIEKVFVYSAEGKLMIESEYQYGNAVSVDHLNPGVYFVKMKSGSVYKTVKLIKK